MIIKTAFKNFLVQFVRITNKFNELNKKAINYGSGVLLYPSEIHVINAIGSNKCNVSDVGINLGITKSAASQVINKLEKKGFLLKYKEHGNNKEICLDLTEKGKSAYSGFINFKNDIFSGLLKKYSEASEYDVKLINTLFQEIENHIDYKLQKYKS